MNEITGNSLTRKINQFQKHIDEGERKRITTFLFRSCNCWGSELGASSSSCVAPTLRGFCAAFDTVKEAKMRLDESYIWYKQYFKLFNNIPVSQIEDIKSNKGSCGGKPDIYLNNKFQRWFARGYVKNNPNDLIYMYPMHMSRVLFKYRNEPSFMQE